MLIKMIALHRRDFLQIPVGILGFTLIYELLIGGVMLRLRPPDVPIVLESITTVMAWIYFGLITTGYAIYTFTLGVRMGATRRQMFGVLMGFMAVQSALLIIMVKIATYIDEVLCVSLWRTFTPNLETLPFDGFSAWWMLPMGLALGVVFALVLGALTLRYGTGGNSMFWAGFASVWFLNVTGILDIIAINNAIRWMVIVGIVPLFIWSIWQYFHVSIKV